ncbi:MAG TPA: type IV pilin [Methanosarcina sp.]|nr:type IV pilin [Methanosarcina sp.]
MDLKKLFNNNKAVSPVIGVVLMVAITVILAAAIGSSVFGQGPAKSAPQANIDIKAYNLTDPGYLKFEHLGGDPIRFNESTTTKVLVEINGTSYEINATGLGILDVGSVSTVSLNAPAGEPAVPKATSGMPIKVKVIDVQTKQMICDKNIRF